MNAISNQDLGGWQHRMLSGAMVGLLTLYGGPALAQEEIPAAEQEAPPPSTVETPSGTPLMTVGPGQEAFIEDFADPLGRWTEDWFYLNTNAENFYVADGNCNPNNRGNNPQGLWISDDRGCDTLVRENPVRINILNGFGDPAVSFSLDQFTCRSGVTFNIYDKDGTLVVSDSLTLNCFTWQSHSWTLSNGISAFEYVGAAVEGATALDNVTLVFEKKAKWQPPSEGCLAVRNELGAALDALQACKEAYPSGTWDTNCASERERFHACVDLALKRERGGICKDGDPSEQPGKEALCFGAPPAP